jgi:hypothetical protein
VPTSRRGAAAATVKVGGRVVPFPTPACAGATPAETRRRAGGVVRVARPHRGDDDADRNAGGSESRDCRGVVAERFSPWVSSAAPAESDLMVGSRPPESAHQRCAVWSSVGVGRAWSGQNGARAGRRPRGVVPSQVCSSPNWPRASATLYPPDAGSHRGVGSVLRPDHRTGKCQRLVESRGFPARPSSDLAGDRTEKRHAYPSHPASLLPSATPFMGRLRPGPIFKKMSLVGSELFGLARDQYPGPLSRALPAGPLGPSIRAPALAPP